jgi:predicted O-methyltransferase YrrM
MNLVNSTIRGLYETRRVLGQDGVERPLDPLLPESFAVALQDTVRQHQPRVALEVGMACGMSSLAILAGLHTAGPDGRLISIDPHQSTSYHGAGVANVARAGLAGRHELVEKPDYLALPNLLEKGTRLQFAYIDGWHTFDYVLLDLFYIDKMLDAGGIIAFNDCGWRSVHRALGFLTSHRRYRELNVGLRPDYGSGRLLGSLLRYVQGRSNSDRYFQKIESWEPSYDFYSQF